MTFDEDSVLQHLVKYPTNPDVTIHSLACEKDCSLIESKNMLKRKAKNFLSKKDYYRYFDGDVEVDEWLFANATSRLTEARAKVANEFPVSSNITCDEIQDMLFKIDGSIMASINAQSGKKGARKYNEILEIELADRKIELQDIRRARNCFEIDAETQATGDTELIGRLGAQTQAMKRGTEGGNTFLYLMVGIGIVGLGLIAAFSSKKGK